jgi:pimeloyl-ACP methyl ester carboxylesterase
VTALATLTRVGAHAIEHIDTGSGPALLAVHGGMGGYDQSWLLARALLADVTRHRVVAVSRPGYLRTPLSAGESAEEQADLFARLLDALRIERTSVAAVSAGGAPALQFALRHPDRCQAMVLVSAVTGRLENNPEIERRMRIMGAMARVPGLPWLVRRKVMRDPRAGAYRSVRNPTIRERLLADSEATRLLHELQVSVTRDLRRRLPGTLNDTRRLSELPEIPAADIRVPILVIHGTDDDVVPYVHAQRLAANCPTAKLLGIEGAEHVVVFTHVSTIRGAVESSVRTV